MESPSPSKSKPSPSKTVIIKPKKSPVKPPQPKPPVAGALKPREPAPSQFRKFYDRGDLPISVEHKANGNKLHWKLERNKLDYHHYLPIFFEGLREQKDPYKFLARQGVADLLEEGKGKILQVVPQLIVPIKGKFNHDYIYKPSSGP
jgi:hypothetical protein